MKLYTIDHVEKTYLESERFVYRLIMDYADQMNGLDNLLDYVYSDDTERKKAKSDIQRGRLKGMIAAKKIESVTGKKLIKIDRGIS